jgi:hypothetical protein
MVVVALFVSDRDVNTSLSLLNEDEVAAIISGLTTDAAARAEFSRELQRAKLKVKKMSVKSRSGSLRPDNALLLPRDGRGCRPATSGTRPCVIFHFCPPVK